MSLLSSPQGRSRQFIYSQYDQRVGTNTIKDSSYPIAILRLPESGRQLAFSMGCRPYLMKLDLEQGAKDAVFFPALKLALKGFSLLAVTDCLNFGNPEKPEIMGEFVLSVEKIAEACQLLDTPIISGNVSFYNESESKNITPTPSIVMTGLKAEKSLNPAAGFHKTGEKVYLLYSHQFCFSAGIDKELLSKKESSAQLLAEEIKEAYGDLQGPLVKVFMDQIRCLSQKNLFSSARAVGKFGLAYTLARMILENKVGFSLSKSFNWPLFQERLYEVVVSVREEDESNFKKELDQLGLEYAFLGETCQESVLNIKGETLFCEEIQQEYKTKWQDISL